MRYLLSGDFTTAFLGLLFEGVPFILLGSLLSGCIDAFVPATFMTRLMPPNRAGAVWVAGLIGVLLPMCECGVVPVMRRLLQRGLPVSCALTYMLASPIVNPIVVVSTLAAFKGNFAVEMTIGRVILGYLIAVTTGLVAMRFSQEQLLREEIVDQLTTRRRSSFAAGLAAQETPDNITPEPAWKRKLAMAVRATATDFSDTMVFFIAGAAIASWFNVAVPSTLVDNFAGNTLLATLSMMIAAFVFSVCSTSDAFIAAMMFKLPLASRLAFLVFGPMLDIKLCFLYSMVFRKKVVFVLGVGLFIVTAFACMQYGRVALVKAMGMP